MDDTDCIEKRLYVCMYILLISTNNKQLRIAQQQLLYTLIKWGVGQPGKQRGVWYCLAPPRIPHSAAITANLLYSNHSDGL